MRSPPETRHYAELLRYARRVSRRADEAEDLLQTVFVAAIEAGRDDLSHDKNRRWLRGALRKRALFEARTAVRRRARESATALTSSPKPAELSEIPDRFVRALPPGLQTTAQLVLSGHSKAEIRWLLNLTDAALRQRIAQLRRRWRVLGGGSFTEFPGLSGGLSFGKVRSALLGPVRREAAMLATHDPDGHLTLLSAPHAALKARGVDS